MNKRMMGKLLLMCFFLGTLLAESGNKTEKQPYSPAAVNINNWLYWEGIDGFSAKISGCKNKGMFPYNTAGVIYQDGLVWGGKVLDPDPQKPQLRVGGQYYGIATQPGWIVQAGAPQTAPLAVDPQNTRVRVYRFRRDFASAPDMQLARDAANYFQKEEKDVTAADIDSLRNRYWQDAKEWPADLGAPYYDRNNNGVWDADYDEPGIAGADQLIWYVVNDLDAAKTKALYGSPPMGLEIQVTLWAYKQEKGALANTVFKRYRFVNKSGFVVDSMFIGQWTESDIGDYTDDFTGCDPALNMGYTYNAYPHDTDFDVFSMSPPAVAYLLLQGPETASGDRLSMTSFWFHASGSCFPEPVMDDYKGTVSMYGRLNGYAVVYGTDYSTASRTMFTHAAGAQSGQKTLFPLNGDPVAGSGDIDGAGYNFAAGNRYFFINSGPFSMEPGQVQDAVFAIVGGLADHYGNNLEGVADLQQKAPLLQQTYASLLNTPAPQGAAPYFRLVDPLPDANQFVLGQNFPNPFNNTTHIRFQVFESMVLELAVYNALGQEIRVLYDGSIAKGDHTLTWNGVNEDGTAMPSGLYFIRLKNGARVQWRKMIYLK